jgi:preprotein translocase subunit SecA
MIVDMRHGVIDDIIAKYAPADAYPETWEIAEMGDVVQRELNITPPLADWAKEEGITDEILRERLEQASDEAYAARVEKNGADLMRYIEKQILLQSLDQLWREHLVTLDHLRQVIGWRGLAQRDPLNEYKSEAFELFGELITQLRETTTAQLNHVEVAYEAPPLQAQSFDSLTPPPASFLEAMQPPVATMPPPAAVPVALRPQLEPGAAPARDPNNPASWGKVGRNELCPCGSGKKYKHCHGQIG